MSNKEFQQLLRKVSKQNCKQSFDKIFVYYYPRLVDYADLYLESRESAEEIASDVLLKLFVKKHHWSFIEKPEAYLYKAVKNLSISHLRKTKKDTLLMKLDEKFHLNIESAVEASPERKILEEEFHTAVTNIIEKMPPRRKVIFKLVKQEEKSYKEVSALLNISIKTVEVHMGLALSQIRTSLEKYDKQDNLNYLRVAKSLLVLFALLS